MFHNVTWAYTSASKTPIPQYNLSVKVVPANAPDSILDSLKTKISWGGMPPDPPRGRVLSHTDLWFAAPIFIKLYFCPPLQHFLNEGLTSLSCLLYLYTHSDCRMTRKSCLLSLYTHCDCRMTGPSCLLYLCTHSDCRMIRTSCLLYLCTHSDCKMTRTYCLLYLYTHSDCRMTRTSLSCIVHP